MIGGGAAVAEVGLVQWVCRTAWPPPPYCTDFGVPCLNQISATNSLSIRRGTLDPLKLAVARAGKPPKESEITKEICYSTVNFCILFAATRSCGVVDIGDGGTF